MRSDIYSRVSHFISFPTLPPRRRLPHSVLEPDLLLDLGGRLFRFFSPVEHAAHIADVGGAQPLFRRHELFLLFLADRSEEHTSELQPLMRISYAVFCLKKKNKTDHDT